MMSCGFSFEVSGRGPFYWQVGMFTVKGYRKHFPTISNSMIRALIDVSMCHPCAAYTM
jgi:hypothetical protein